MVYFKTNSFKLKLDKTVFGTRNFFGGFSYALREKETKEERERERGEFFLFFLICSRLAATPHQNFVPCSLHFPFSSFSWFWSELCAVIWKSFRAQISLCTILEKFISPNLWQILSNPFYGR